MSHLRTLIARAAFRLRGSALAGAVIRQAFAHASGLLPVRRVAENPRMIAFHHPVPGFAPVHLLLVPKLSAPSVLHLSAVQREQISAEVELIAREALERLELAQSGFVVVVNGGARQDARQVHFHVVTNGYELAAAPAGLAAGVWTDIPDPAQAVHQVRAGGGPVLAGLTHVAAFGRALQLGSRGYSIIWDQRDPLSHGVVHLTAGMPESLP
ncbi:MAG TPA: HIT domain-containing protein [Acidimicrobiia bacterium]|nr:HIT domain-containing protein [Acidimicrobiia bacterium]